jgi:hypothetical protein
MNGESCEPRCVQRLGLRRGRRTPSPPALSHPIKRWFDPSGAADSNRFGWRAVVTRSTENAFGSREGDLRSLE